MKRIDQRHIDHPKFYTKSGWLTPYALACGYIHQAVFKGIFLTLWHEGGTVYHVRAHDHRIGMRLFWETYETLGAARKMFTRASRNYSRTPRRTPR